MRYLCLSWVLVVVLDASALGQSKTQPAAAGQLFQDASRLQNSGKFAEALAKWQAFLRNFPDDAAVGLAYQGLGTCLLETGEWSASLDALNQALKRLPKGESDSTIRWNMAIALYRRSEKTPTKEHCRQVEQALQGILADKEASKERRLLAKFYLARTERTLGKTPIAKEHFEELLKETTDKTLVPAVLLALAGFAEEAKDWPAARGHYRAYLKDFADHASVDEARLGLADVLLQEGQYKEAEELFGRLSNRKGLPAMDYAHFRWAELAELQGDNKAAAQRWTAFLGKHPMSGLRERALRRTGEVQFKLKEYAEAAAAFSTWLKENPTNEALAPTQVQLGLALVQLEKFPEAEPLFKTALEGALDAEYRGQAVLGLARCAARLNRQAEAVKHYAAFFETKTGLAEAETTRLEAVATAFAASDTKRGLEWTDLMVKEFAKSPWTSQAQLHAARHLSEKGHFEDAWQRSRWVLEAKVPEAQPIALYLAGFCAMKLRKFDDAITYYQTLRDEHPKAEQAPVAVYSLGVAFESQGALSKAVAAYEDYLKRYPDHGLADQARKRVKVLREKR